MPAMTDKEHTYVGLDLSGSQTRCLVAAASTGRLRYLCSGSVAPVRWNSENEREEQLTGNSILEAVYGAEQSGSLTILSAVLGLSDGQVGGRLLRTSLGLADGPREVGIDDVRTVVRKAEHGLTGSNATVLQIVPLEFIVGSHAGLTNPIGYTADELEVYSQVVSMPRTKHDWARQLVNQASIRVEETLLAGYAAGLSTLTLAERMHGVVHVDFGKESSSLTIFVGNTLRHARGIPIGRDTVVDDVARAFSTEVPIASSLITDFGSAVHHQNFNGAYVFVPNKKPISERDFGRHWPRSILDKLIALRIEECMTVVRNELLHSDVVGEALQSVVLTGELMDLDGVQDAAETVVGLPCRVGSPTQPRGLPEHARNPSWSCAAGLVLYAHRLVQGSGDYNEQVETNMETRMKEVSA